MSLLVHLFPTSSGGTTYSSAANLYAVVSLNAASGRRGGGRSNIYAVVNESAAPGNRHGGNSNIYAAVQFSGFPQVRRGGTANIFSVISANGASGRRGGSTAHIVALASLNGNSGRRGGSTAALLVSTSLTPSPGRRGGAETRILATANIFGRGDKRIAGQANLLSALQLKVTGARLPPTIVEPAGKSIMRNKIRVLDNDRYSSRGVQFDGDNSFTVKLTQNEAGRLEIYYDHLLEAGDYVVSVVATINGETPPVISLNVAGTIATMIVSGGGSNREMTIVATTFFGLADEIKLCIRDYVRPRARPRDY